MARGMEKAAQVSALPQAYGPTATVQSGPLPKGIPLDDRSAASAAALHQRARRDVVIIGGGHNGLVAAAYLARAGLSALVCESRDIVGGAAVSEHPFGPDYTMTSLSYVVSLLPRIWSVTFSWSRHGYHVYPQGPYFAPRADGRYLRLPHDSAESRAQIAKFSPRDAISYDAYEAHMAGIGAILGPMLTEIPPRLGSHRPQDLLRQGLLLRHLKKVDARSAVDITRLLTGSIADLLDGISRVTHCAACCRFPA